MKTKTRNRVLASLLALVMVLGMLPMGALAAWVDDVPLAAVPMGEEVVSVSEAGRGSGKTLAGEAYTPADAAAEGKEVHYLAFDAAGFTNGTTATAVTIQNASGAAISAAPATGTIYRIVCGNQIMSAIYTSAPEKVTFRSANNNIPANSTGYQFKLFAGANGGYKIQSQNNTAYYLTHGIKENVTLGANPAFNAYILDTAGEEFFITPVTDGSDGAYHVWYAVEPQQTPYTPADAVAEGKDVYYFSKATFGWSLEKNSTASAAITVNTGGTAVTGGLVADTEYTFAAGGTNLYAPFSNAGAGVTNVTAQGSAAAAFRLAPEAADGHVAYKIKVSSNGTDYYLTHTEVPFTFNNNSWKGIQLDTAGEAFYITPAADPNDGTYYIWYAAEREDPGPSETIEHHTPTEGMNQHYLQYNGSGAWIGGNTDNANIRLDAYDTTYTQYTKADVQSGTYAIYSSRSTEPKWMHVVDDAINRCTNQEDADAHRFTFTYDAQAHGYTIRSKATGKYLSAQQGSLSMASTGTIFYIDKIQGGNFYHIWWESEIRPGEAIRGMFDAAPDNTWVFTGGEDVAGGWAQTGGKRNFMGHFEEYVRWTYAQSGYRDSTTKERYTVNTAYAGLTLADIVGGKWQERVAAYDPRAAVYMVGAEDKDDANFGEHLNAFINNAIALRDGSGFAVIIKSYDSSLSSLNAAVDTVMEGLKSDSGKYNRVVVADTALTDAQLTDDRHPNAAGHLELSKQLVTAACSNGNTGGNYPGGIGIKNVQEVASPADYDTETVPTVNVAGGAMTITLNGVGSFRYELRLDNGVTISGAGANGSATVTDVPENVGYTLVTRSTDGATQYKTVTTETALSALQQKLVDKVNDKNTPLTWLFMGDSITHACHWLGGYDSVAQLTEDFLGTLGRDKDVVINTAVSSATTASTLDSIDYRLKQFPAPDVASIMLGTNDCGGIDAATTYKENLNTIIDAIQEKNPNAVIILRSPTGNWTPREVRPYCETMKTVAAERNCIYIDQHTETQGMLDTYRSWIRNNTASFPAQVYYGNDLHPGAKAQLDMAKMFFKGIGLWDEDNPISNHDYVLTTAETSATSVSGALQRGEGTLTLNVSALGGSLGETTLTATNAAGQSWSVTAKAGTNPTLTLPDGAYTVTASAIKTNEAKTVTFASATVEIGEDVPPIETQGYPEPDPGKVQHYLDFGSSWVSVTAPAALELYGVSGSVYTKDTDGIDSGVYGIHDPTPGDGGAARWMHVSGDVTNQCGSNPADHTASHSFTFTYNAEKKAYTIQSVNNGKYLTQTRSGSQFAVNDTPTWFYVSPADPENNDGTYYIWWETEPQAGEAISEMFNAEPGNTWVFTGGVDVAGQFDQTRGRRSFAGQFEEYFRWHFQLNGDENAVGGFSPARQRYVINTAYAGLTLNTIVSESGWQERVADFAPRAVTYMVGGEDLEHEASFEADLAAFIDKATALREGNGFAVIMKSYDSSLSALNDKVDSVVEGYRNAAAGKYSHIVVVDALALTAAQLTAGGHPNADGHMELGRNLAVAVGGTANAFPGNAQNRYTEAAMPTFNKTVTPTVAWNDGVMTISGLTGAFTYQVKLASGVTVSGAGTNTATVTDLPDGAAYTLITRTENGGTQYQTVTGLVGGGAVPAKTGEQKKIADLLAAHPDDSLTWLFVGDSITHGILVSGYDSAPQLMEEYLDTIGRKKDVVVNAGVSSATTASTLNAKAYRLEPFTADVAIIMLGTNDCSTNLTGNKAISKETYKENLGKIVDAIRANNPNAVIVMRTPTGFWDDKHPQMSEYVAQLTAFAEERGLILVDQMTATQHAINTYPWSKSGAQFYGDNLHPGVVGQLKIFQMLIREMGLWNDDNEICNLDYLWDGMTSENSATGVSSGLRVNGSQLSLNVSALGANLGRTTLTATNGAGQSWSVLAEAGEIPSLTLPDGTYTVTATSLKKSEAKEVTFAAATLAVSGDVSKLPAPAPLTETYEYRKASGAFTEGTYAIVGTSVMAGDGARVRVIHAHVSNGTLTVDHCQINANDTAGGDTLTIDHENHLFNAARSGDGFTFQVAGGNAAGKYLHGEGDTLSLSDTPTVFTVTALADGGYNISWAEGKYLAWTGNFRSASSTAYKLNLYKKTGIPPEMAQTVFKGTGADKPMDQENPQSYYRIPALVTLPNGWVVAASDIRWPNGGDSPNNLDTIVSISKDGGVTWDWEVVNYFSDYAPLKNAGTKADSASFIDPALAVDGSGKLWMAVDLQPTHVNLGQNGQKTGSGFDENGLLMVAPISEEEWNTKVNTSLGRTEATRLQYQAYYEYRADVNGEADLRVTKGDKEVSLHNIFHKDDADRTPTGYYVDAFYDLWYDYGGDEGIQPVLILQKDSNKAIQANIFYKASPWKAYSTTYLMIRTAEVEGEGLAWSEPSLVSGVKNFDGETFLAFCPGRGTVVKMNETTERIIFPVYDNVSGEKTSVVYSDDGGATWHRGARVQNGNVGKTSESQVVTLPGKAADGTPLLRIYSRNTNAHVSFADSSDGGATWTASTQDMNVPAVNTGNGCMVSFINLEGCLVAPDNTIYENLILASYPRGDGRKDGVVRIGSIGTDANYTVTWLNDADDVRFPGGFAYSCVTQLRDWTSASAVKEPISTFGLLYEGVPTYANVTVADLLGEDWTFLLEKPEAAEIPAVSVTGITGSENTADNGGDLLDLNVAASGTVSVALTSETGAVTWSSSNESVATVEAAPQPARLSALGDLVAGNSTATITAHAPGRAVITATVVGNGMTRAAEVEVVVSAEDQITVPDRYADQVNTTVVDAYTEYVLDTDGADEGVYVIVGTPGRSVSMHDSGNNTNQCGVTIADNKVPLTHNEHKWTFARQADGKYTIRSNGGKYLTSTLSGGQLTLSTTAEAFTVTHSGNGDYQITSAAGKYIVFVDSNGVNWTARDAAGTVKLFQEINHPEVNTYAATTAKLRALIAQAGKTEAEYADILGLARTYETEAEANAAQARVSQAAQALYGEWTGRGQEEPPAPTTYTVTFTGEGVTASSVTVEEGETVTLPAPVRQGYRFDGWFNGETRFTEDTPVTEDLTLTARWVEIVVPNDWGNVALAVTPNPVTPGGTLQVTVANVPEDAADLTLNLQGEEIALNRNEDGTYTGTLTAPTAEGARSLTFVISAGEYAPKLLQVIVTVRQPAPPTPPTGGGGGGSRPTPPEEDLNDPDVPLANGPMLFEDVKVDDWFYDAAKFVYEQDLMQGVSETRFEPYMNTTRGMVVTILYRMEKEPAVGASTFADVVAGAWYAAGAAWGESTGVVKGIDGSFVPALDVTREQLAAFLFRFAQHRGYDVTARGDLTVFTDGAATSQWATDAMSWAVGTGLIQGKGESTLDPQETATRAEVAIILQRFCENADKTEADKK